MCSGARTGSARRRAHRLSGTAGAGFVGALTRNVGAMAKWWTLVAVCVATFMLLLDITVVNVALPYIERDLNASFEDLQWVIDAYALTLAAFLLTAGSVADDIGRRRVFVAGLVVFTIASRCAASPATPLMLNLARGLQGDRRRDDVRHLAGAARVGLPGPRPRHRDRHLGSDDRRAPWPSGRWSAECSSRPSAGRRSSSSTCRSASPRSRSRSCACRSRATRTAAGSTGPARSRSPAALFLLVFGLIRGNAEDWSTQIIVVPHRRRPAARSSS